MNCKYCNKKFDWVEFKPGRQRFMCANKKCESNQYKPTPKSPEIMFDHPENSSKYDNWEYRHGHLMAKAQNERRQAEARSHMGTNPYNDIDDISSGKYFGEVK